MDAGWQSWERRPGTRWVSRDNAQEVGGKGGDQEVICMNRLPSKLGKGAFHDLQAAQRSQRKATAERAAESVLILCGGWGCGRVDSQWNNALRGPPERFGRKPVKWWKFRIIGEWRAHKKTADQKGWEPRKRGKTVANAGWDPSWCQRPDELGVQQFLISIQKEADE